MVSQSIMRDNLGRFIKGHPMPKEWIEKRLKKPKKSFFHIVPKIEVTSDVLGYIVGIVLGDGWLVHDGRAYGVALKTPKKIFAEHFFQALRDIGLNPRMNLTKNKQFRVRGYSKLLYTFLKQITLEDLLKDDNFAVGFFRGFYESEGCLTEKPKGHRLSIYNTDKYLVDLIEELLRRFKFKFSEHNRKRGNKKILYDIYLLGGKREIERFLAITNPCIKSMKVNNYGISKA